MNMGMTELILILAIVIVIFGPSKLPGLGKAFGETIRGFKKGFKESDEKEASPELVVSKSNSNPAPASVKTADSGQAGFGGPNVASAPTASAPAMNSSESTSSSVQMGSADKQKQES